MTSPILGPERNALLADPRRATRLGCVNDAHPGRCVQEGSHLTFLGVVDGIQLLQCDSCAWPMWARGAMVCVDDRNLSESDQRAFTSACATLGIASQDQIRDRDPHPYSDGGRNDAVRVGFDLRGRDWAQNRAAFSEQFGNSKRIKACMSERMSQLPEGAHLRYADVGCGTGGLLERVMAAHSVGHFVGVDLSAIMIASAHARLAPLIDITRTMLDLIVSSGDHMPLRSNWFDLVTAELVLHHLEDPTAVVAEIARIAKPGGVVVVQVPGPGYTLDVNFGDGWINSPIGPKTLPGHLDPLGRFAPEELQALARAARLEPEHVDVDSWRYRFQSVESCLNFLGRTGADARIRGYATPLNLLGAYSHFFGTGPLEIRGEFITLTAVKPEIEARPAVPRLTVVSPSEKGGNQS